MKGLACIGAGVALLAVIVVSSIMNGLVLSILWSWFVTPVFDLPVLTIVQAIGIGLVVTMLTYHKSESKEGKDTTELIAEIVSAAVFQPLFYLFFGWVVRMFL